jgi:hypothetical protein
MLDRLSLAASGCWSKADSHVYFDDYTVTRRIKHWREASCGVGCAPQHALLCL